MNASLRDVWQRLAWRLVLVVAAAAALGAPFGLAWPMLALALAVLLAYTLIRLHRLHRWLLFGRTQPPPERFGLWHELHELLRQRVGRTRKRRRRLLRLVTAFREAAEAFPDALVYLGPEQRILWFNDAALRLLGLQHPRDIGVSVTHLLRSPRVVDWLRAGASEPLYDVAAPNDERRRLGYRLIRYGKIEQQLLVARDISHQTHLEQVRRDFVANVSHELRTPLTVLHGYLDMLDPEDVPELGAMLGEMRAQSTRMTRIVEDLLTLSRLEAGEGLQEERVRMDAMLGTLVREARALSQGAHQVSVHHELKADLLGSTKELHSAFSNLVTNAIRYTPVGGSVRIVWRAEGANAILEVIDTGNGIPAQHLPRITERFYRVSTSRSRESGGTGLGLSIVKHVLALHDARLVIESEVGRGSRFACVFAITRTLATVGEDERRHG